MVRSFFCSATIIASITGVIQVLAAPIGIISMIANQIVTLTLIYVLLIKINRPADAAYKKDASKRCPRRLLPKIVTCSLIIPKRKPQASGNMIIHM